MEAAYGVVTDDGTRAWRITAADYSGVTYIETIEGYEGENLAFTGRAINDASTPQRTKDPEGRECKLVFEVMPPISDAEKRQEVVAAYAGAVLKLEQEGVLQVDTSAIPGTLHISMEATPAAQ